MPSGIKLLGIKNTIWTEKTITEEALKYKTRYSFRKGSSGAYSMAVQKGILNKVCHHMVSGKIKKYSKEFLLQEAKKI